MQKLFRESRDFAARHELDRLLPSAAVTVRLAKYQELPDLAAIARREIPGVLLSEAGLEDFLNKDPESIFIFQCGERLLGGIAFLYLNGRGHHALLLDEIDLKSPRREFLAPPDEAASAIYVWALAGSGRGVVGIGNVAKYLRRPRFMDADYFARPSTPAGRNLLIAIGFELAQDNQRELWRYQRPWRRMSPTCWHPTYKQRVK